MKFNTRNLLSPEEVSKLKCALENKDGVMSHVYSRDDGSGRRSKTVLWNHPGNDLTGVIARSEKLAGTFEKVNKKEGFLELVLDLFMYKNKKSYTNHLN